MVESHTPFYLLCDFARRLGWCGLRVHRVTLTQDMCGKNLPGTIVTYYYTSDAKYFLQINENPVAQSVNYQATICAERYAVRHTPWHEFTVTDDHSVAAEASRLAPCLSRYLFRDRKWRREFMQQNPQLIQRNRIGRRAYQRLIAKA